MTFINLSNHLIASWSAEQLETAAALGFGDPVEFQGGMPNVPPEMDEHEVASLAKRVSADAIAQGATAAFVASDFTFAFLLVKDLTARGIRCFSTTTLRRVEELVLADGTVYKKSVFEFVRWREYL
ncbi:MAG: hypothetical protein JXX14_17775 [Deltaproteobacteria bacterium]|nr:hypothetical protein [Deltaproteobacteria bacterium]